METLKIKTDQEVEEVFKNYPNAVNGQMLNLRKLVRETAEEMPEISVLEETLKWGEPSFVTKHGSTLRMDWKAKSPHQYALYFQCSSRLVETFQNVFNDLLKFEGKRAIVFDLEEKLPKDILKQCIKASLHYHQVKDHITLGI